MLRKLELSILMLCVPVICWLLGAVAHGSSGLDSSLQGRSIDFNRDIRPILSDTCFTCHGPDDKQRKAGLRFDTRDGAFSKPGVIVPGNSSASRLFQRIGAERPEVRMPPPESGHSLTSNQIDLIGRWIDEGARWETHWAYIPPGRPEVPNVRNSAWPRNAIDNFVLERLEKEGFSPSPEADKTTLLRRVTLDLTGLPPTPAEIDSFLADKSSDAFEKRVDQLLRSPHYGERMTMQWLDLARYADTHGYHIDSHRDMWRWRDWVINAFNQNLPFDRFTIEQLAGDLLPNPTNDQLIASGFNRNHMINYEGGAIPEEYQVEYVVDRIETTTNVWMGMTMGCARCHNHKYDPITQKEFYQFFAFFNTISEEGLDGRTGNAKPNLKLPSADQKTRLEELKLAIATKEKLLSDAKVSAAQEAWEKTFTGKVAISPRDGLVAHYELDGNFSDLSGGLRHGTTVTGDPTFGAGQLGRAVNFDGDTQVSFGSVGDFRSNDPFSLTVWLRGSGNTPVAALQKIERGPRRRGWELVLDDLELVGIQRRAARLSVRLISEWPSNAIQVRTTDRLTLGDWYHLTLTCDGSGKATGINLFVNGKLHPTEVIQDSLSGPIDTDSSLQLGNKATGQPFRGGIDDLRLYSRVISPSEIKTLAIDYPVQAILSGVFGKRSKDEIARVRDYFLARAAPESVRVEYEALKSLKERSEELERSIPTVMVMSEMEKPRETFVLGRGDYRNKTEKVMPDVPSVLPPLAKNKVSNRLALAEWLTAPDHPLTARVAVNRYWQMYFGAGIVKTAEDFGSQGDLPSHPKLLDWLAMEFIQSGWDIRAMQRLIVTSATYRQSSRVSPTLLEKDPENRLLARGARLRLPAEFVRDNALAISGLLERNIGGPSVFPYQPRGLWEEMAFGDGFSAQSYVQSKGKDLYRRSLYTFWKRTVPPASLVVFDAPDREKCTARRALTNTPLQALVLLNDPTYLEAARVLAERTVEPGVRDDGRRIASMFRAATGRMPSRDEIRTLLDLLKTQLNNFKGDLGAAQKLIAVGYSSRKSDHKPSEMAAWTIVASTILNLDETITKE
jgi:hypothetical protein